MYYKRKLYKTTFHTTNTPFARKAWTCDLCGEPVPLGERYVKYTWRQTARIDTLNFHPVCWSVVKAYCKDNDTNIFSVEYVNDWRKERKVCKQCTEDCHIGSCQKIAKTVRHKPILTYYDKLKPMEEKQEDPYESMFKVLDE